MKRTFIHHAILVNESKQMKGSVVVEGEKIAEILSEGQMPQMPCDETIEADGAFLIPGVIDDHVHFRDPGLTHKADIYTESCAAAAGGVTSIMDMPNTSPQTTTLEALAAKQQLLDEKCVVNHSCYFGATNNNYNDFEKLDKRHVCGVKLFMGSSTGNMLVDRVESLKNIFEKAGMLIVAHCEDQKIISENTLRLKRELKSDSDLPLALHPEIRSTEACYHSSACAIELAQKAKARLHIAHLSTADELSLFHAGPLSEKRITAEACVSHLMFSSDDYASLGTRIKCNPAIKGLSHREALRQAVNDNVIDVIATDHAPHLLSEKEGGALKAMSGMPMIQFSLICMLELVYQHVFSLETVVQKMCHAPADLFDIENRGYLREGYQADLVLIKPSSWTLSNEQILSKCKWSPLEGRTFHWEVVRTFVNGQTIYKNKKIQENIKGQALCFRRKA